MPSRDVQQTSSDGPVAPAFETSPWEPQERVVSELFSTEAPLHLSEEHVVKLQESESIIRVS
jgi:hypothetical protein